MSRSAHSKRWYQGERYSMSKVERERAKVRKVRRKSERERRRRDNKVTEWYSDQGHSSCGRKIRYESRAKALRYIERHYAEVPLSVYKCPYCGGWHLTSHPWTDTDGGDLTVREVLEAARDAALQIRRIEEEFELKRQAIGPQGYSVGPHSKNGVLDPMRKVDEMLDAQDELVDIAELQDPLDEAWDVVSGMSHIVDDLTVELATRYYLQAESWTSIARDLADERKLKVLVGMPRGEQAALLSKTMDAAIDGIEYLGIAHLKEMGR